MHLLLAHRALRRVLRLEEVFGRHTQAISYYLNSIKRGICATTLYSAHVTAGKATLVGERLLR